MLVPYFEIARGYCESSYYSPSSYDAEVQRLHRAHQEHNDTRYVFDTDTRYVRIWVLGPLDDEWEEVGGAPLIKLGADLRKRIEFAHATARAHDYWL